MSLEYIRYLNFEDIPIDKRKSILRRLGISSGTMRKNAKIYNPTCVVAYYDNLPIGWSIYLAHSDEVNVFVSVPYRKQGIGTRLLDMIMEQVPDDKLAQVYPYNNTSYNIFNNNKNKDKIRIVDLRE